ncbi:unnamed protein product [Trifolium pratense]|uniref:Uncharacterized protein n=1 Tax=Trifolium pratense TaxID=57577 RepID=A0ACB0J0D0_TRIPR|nr:unnamed protein product [Trifolium pratense]
MVRGIHDNMKPKKSESHDAKEPSSGEYIVLNHEVTNYNKANNSVSPLLNSNSQHKHIQETKTTTNKSCSISSSSSSSSFHATTSSKSSSSSTSSNSHFTKNNAISFTMKNPSHVNIFIDLYKKIKASLSKSISLLREKCSCFDKNSLQVKEKFPKPKTSNTTTSSPPTFQIQTLSQNQITRNSLSNKTTPKDKLTIDEHEDQQEVARDSMHVFQLTSPHKSRAMDEDVTSDASSDLFEIEGFCFSTQATTTSPNVLCDT